MREEIIYYHSVKGMKWGVKSKELVDKYSMTDWDKLARRNEEAVASVRKSVEEMDKKG